MWQEVTTQVRNRYFNRCISFFYSFKLEVELELDRLVLKEQENGTDVTPG